MKKGRARARDTFTVFVEVHQNGELLSKTSRPFNKKGKIFLTSDPAGELTAPFYPLASDIKILNITQRGVEIDLDPNWEGFTTCEGKIEDINSNKRSAYTHIMKKGDYGSFAYDDLRVLIRIGKDRIKTREAVSITSEYRGSLRGLWLGEDRSLLYLGSSVFLGLWLIGGFILGLLYHPDKRPKNFIDLRLEYTLPFIDPRHIKWAPESLQTHYERTAPLRSTLNFVQVFTDTVLGFEALRGANLKHDVIFEATRARYDVLHRQHRSRLLEIEQDRQKLEQTTLTDSRMSLVSLPVIKGESLTGSLLRLEDKLQIWYENTEKSYSLRSSVSEAFRKDRLYDFNEYRDLNKVIRTDFQTSVDPRDEAAMYDEVDTLARTAAAHRERLLRHRDKVITIDPTNSQAALVPIDSQALSFIDRDDFAAFNRKIRQIQASTFNPEKPKVVREPLIGTLDPKLIQQTVERYRFELQLCYELALRRNQQAAGSMEWQWHLDTQGQVYDVELVESGIQDSKMVDCIREKIKSWQWPRPQKGSVRISFPFHFKPAKG